MAIVSSEKDLDAFTLTIVSEFHAPVERIWQLWEDPRQLERWWGPPGYPATFTRHDFRVPGTSVYYMTTPEGETPHGYFRYLAIDKPSMIDLTSGFGDGEADSEPGMPDPGVIHVTFEEADGVTRMSIDNRFGSAEHMEQDLEMGMEIGMTLALGQIDAILAE